MENLDAARASAVELDLAGHTALVTGAESGIGLACARRLARAGTSVTVLELDGSSANSAEEVGGTSLVADLSDPAALDGLSMDADIVLNNAGMQYVSPVEEFPSERFAAMLKVMLEAPFRIVQKALPGMYERGWGRIINISSVHGLRASPYKDAYVSAKHGLKGLSKTVALEGEVVEKIMLTEPAIKRLVEPEEVAEAVLFLCSPAASFMNGSSFVMDGG